MDFQTKTTFLSIDYWLNCKSRGDVSNAVIDVYQSIKLLDDIDGETGLVDQIASICLFIRDHYQGLDQQKLSIWMILEMEAYFPCFGSSMVEILPKFGCWKDLNLLLLEINNGDKWAYQYLEETIYHHIQTVFNKDIQALHNNSLLDNHQITNLVKFIGKEKRGLDRKIGFAKKFVKLNYREEYQYSPAKALQHYRQDCRALMTYINNYKPIVNIKVNPLVNLSQQNNNDQIKTTGPGQDFVFDIVKQTRRYTQNEEKFRQKYIETQLDCYLNDLHYPIPERVQTRLDNLESYQDQDQDQDQDIPKIVNDNNFNLLSGNSLPSVDYLSSTIVNKTTDESLNTPISFGHQAETNNQPDSNQEYTNDFWKSYLTDPIVNIQEFNLNNIPLHIEEPIQTPTPIQTPISTPISTPIQTPIQTPISIPIPIPVTSLSENSSENPIITSNQYHISNLNYEKTLPYDYSNTYSGEYQSSNYNSDYYNLSNTTYDNGQTTTPHNYDAYNTGEYPNYYDNSYYNYYYNMYTPSNIVNNYNSASHCQMTNQVNNLENYQTCQRHDGYHAPETTKDSDKTNECYLVSADILYQIPPNPYQPDENDELIDLSHICDSTLDPISPGQENIYLDTSSSEDDIPELISISMSNDSEDYWDDPMDIDQSEFDIINEGKMTNSLSETCQVFNEPNYQPETDGDHCEYITNLTTNYHSEIKTLSHDISYQTPKIITYDQQDIPIIKQSPISTRPVNQPENVICEITHKYNEYWRIMVEGLVKRDKQEKIASFKASFRTYQQVKASNTIKKYLRVYLEKQANDPDAFVFVDDKDFVC